ncbi:DUF1774-domain-containing protein [Trichodelitschia bisporula]|uniref:DUF1774-domain-containing protein n=1 Tax=Trichodelitschia bisporula TaxID=703511 RepID=A0A6G1HIX6_9PEZI|nr:DUF1774-domain-containing protein [Trichodelitschia bisporula]
MDHVRNANPFTSQSSYSRGSVLAWRIVTPVSWLILVITSIYYSATKPHEGKYSRHTIWGQNSHRHTPFALNSVIASLYWIALYILQVPYLSSLFKEDNTLPLTLASHFTAHNLLTFGFIHLWCRSYFWWALLLVIINWFNLTFAYFRYPKTPRVTHVAIIAGPLAWAFVSLYWDGAAAVHSHHTAARIVANVFLWTWLVYGAFYIVAFKDWAMGFALSILAAALGVGQFFTAIIALQWIFAFTIMAVLFVASLPVAAPGVFGGDVFKRGEVVSEDRERAPLLAEP